MEVSFHPIGEAEIQELLAELLPEDRQEIEAMGYSVEWGVRHSVEISIECVAVRGDGRLACLTGVAESTALAPRIFPWMLATELVLIDRKSCLKVSRKLINRWTGQYPYMTNWVDQRHTRAVNWLQWLGAKLTPEPYGPYQRPFYKFEFGDPECA